MKVASVSCTLVSDVSSAPVIDGNAGRYMSVARGAIAESRARTHNMGRGIARFTREPYRRGHLRIPWSQRRLSAWTLGRPIRNCRPRCGCTSTTTTSTSVSNGGRSEHTVRAYRADVAGLLGFLCRDRPDAVLADLDLRGVGAPGSRRRRRRVRLGRRSRGGRRRRRVSPPGPNARGGCPWIPASGWSPPRHTVRCHPCCARSRPRKRWSRRNPVRPRKIPWPYGTA